jgi:hypothetical protein
MAVGKDLRMRVQMAILREPMAPRGSVAGVGRAWTKNSNARRKAAARATQELSTCKFYQEIFLGCPVLTEVVFVDTGIS